MDIWQAISTYSPGVAVGALCLYFYNQFVLRTLDERKEWLEERKNWMVLLKDMVDRYEESIVNLVSSQRDAAAQDHALRGKVQEFVALIETRLRNIEMKLHESTSTNPKQP